MTSFPPWSASAGGAARGARLGLLAALIAAAVPAQVRPVARLTPAGSHDVWETGDPSSGPIAVLRGVTFLPIQLAGYALRDRLRLDLPRLDHDGAASHVLLADGGALYLVGQGATTSLMHVTTDGHAALVVTVPDLGGKPGIAPGIAVSLDGRLVLLATSPAAGGNLLRVDLDAGAAPPVDLTAGVPPLDIEALSLRVSPAGAFWVADEELWRAPVGGSATLVQPGLGGLPVLGDLVLAADGRRVAAVAGSEDIEDGDRRIFVADIAGPHVVVTPAAGRFEEAGHDDPLGPFLAISEDGSLVAFRETGATHELFVREVDLPSPPLHLTVAAYFPAYIDNVGVLGFKAGRSLQFFAGDVTISGVDAQEMIGAGDLYQAELPLGSTPSFANLSVTSGQTLPPYDNPGQLQFSEAVLDPFGQRYLLVGEDANETQTLTAVAVGDGLYAGTIGLFIEGLDSDPQLLPAASAVLVISEVETMLGGVPTEVQRLDLLPSIHGTADSPLVTIGVLPNVLAVDRFAVSRGGEWLAFVVSAGPGLELPVLVALPSGVALLALGQPFGVSPDIAFAGSELICGLGAPGGPYKFAAFSQPGLGALLALPAGGGFPLAH